MKRMNQFAMLVVLILASTLTTHAQPPVGPGPDATPTPGNPNPVVWTGIRPPQEQGLISLTTVSGTIQQFTANDESILDGFTLNTGSKTIAVSFPPHMGQAIQTAGKSAKQVTVTGSSEVTPEGETVFRLVSLNNGQTTVTNTPPAAPTVLVSPTATTVKGKVVDYQLDRQGQVNGLRLSDQTLVRVPPHVVAQLLTIAPKESSISVEGFVRPLGEGQVQLQKQNVVEASSITVNGQSFLIR